jgi:hypothetical protein
MRRSRDVTRFCHPLLCLCRIETWSKTEWVRRDRTVVDDESVMSEHKFKIGERLFPARSVGLDVSKGAYVVVKRLPKHNGEFEYQIKSVSEIDERIVRESQLKPSPWRNQAGRPYSA